MTLFDPGADPLTAPLAEQFAPVAEALARLGELLHLESYNDLGGDADKRNQLAAIDDSLRQHLAHQLQQGRDVTSAPLRLRREFVAAWLLAGEIASTVGPRAETLSTLELDPYDHVGLPDDDGPKREAIFQRACQTFGLRDEEAQELLAQRQRCRDRVASKRLLVDVLRRRLVADDGQLDRVAITALADACYGRHGLTPNELEVVATRSAIHFLIPRPEACASDAGKRFVESNRRFRFEQFSHFPMFGPFDGRQADPALVTSLADELGWSQADVREQLSQVITTLETEDCSKYLVHDTWGHIWQAECTELRRAYDELATLQMAPSVDEMALIDDDNVVALADLLYPDRDGSIIAESDRMDRFIGALVRRRAAALLAPVLAELAADAVEYGVLIDIKPLGIPMPNSSLVGDRPGKPDLALADLSYFTKALLRPIRLAQQKEALRENGAERLALVLRQRFPANCRAVSGDLAEAIRPAYEAFLDRFVRQAEEHLSAELEARIWQGRPQLAAGGQIFANLLRIQYSLADCYGALEERAAPAGIRWLLPLVLVRLPLNNLESEFWSLDEDLSEWALSFLDWFAEASSTAG